MPTRDWRRDLIAFNSGTHPDFSGFTATQIGNILQFVHQKCEQVDLLAQAARSKPWRYSLCHPARHFIVCHTEPQTLVSFKCRILACYSPQVKEFLGRSAWDYDEFLMLEDAIPAVAGTYWIMSPFQTSYVGSARSQVPECPDNTGEGGLQQRIKAHKGILSQGSETILRSYSARHVLPTPIIPGLGAANNALYCHVMLSQDTDKFRAQHMETEPGQQPGQQPGRDAIGFRVLTHAFDVTAGAGQSFDCTTFLSILESLDILFTRSLEAIDNGYQSPECFAIQGSFSKSYVTPTNRALPWSQCSNVLWTAKHQQVIKQVRGQMVEHFGNVPWVFPYHIIFSRFEAEGLACPKRLLILTRWRALFPDDGKKEVLVEGPDLTLNIVDFICEHGPVYAATNFSEFKAKHGLGLGCHSERSYRSKTDRLSLLLYDNFVEPLSLLRPGIRPWSIKLRDNVVRRVQEHWGGSILTIVGRLRDEFQQSPSAQARASRASLSESERKQEAFWGSVLDNSRRLDIHASSWALTRFVESYHARNPIITREDAVRFFEVFPEFTPDQHDAPAALQAFLKGMNKPVTQDEARDDTAPCLADHLLQTQELGLDSLFDDAGEAIQDWTANGNNGGEGASDFESDFDADIVAKATAQTPFSPSGGGEFPGYSVAVANNREQLKRRLKSYKYGILLYGLQTRSGQRKPYANEHERSDASMDWSRAENNVLWTILTNTNERADWSTTHIDPLSFRGPDLGLPHARAWWAAPTDNSVCNYPGLGRFTWAQVRDHAPKLGFGLQMNGDGFGVFPLPTLGELDAIEGFCTDVSSEYIPKERPTRADLCNYPGLTRFNWGQLRLIASMTCGIKIQLFQPSGDLVVGRNHVFYWGQPEIQALRRLKTNDSHLLKGCHQPPKSQEQCDYPGLERFNWRAVCVRAMELCESDPGADLPKRSGKKALRQRRVRTWSPEQLNALETLISNHPDKLAGGRYKAKRSTQCSVSGLEALTWNQVYNKADKLGLLPCKWSPERLAALETLIRDHPDKLVGGRSKSKRSTQCNFLGLGGLTWNSVYNKIDQLGIPRKWSPERLAALETLKADHPDKLVEGRRKGRMQCDYPGLKGLTWNSVCYKVGHSKECQG